MLTAWSIIFNAANQSLWEFTGATDAEGMIRMVMRIVLKKVTDKDDSIYGDCDITQLIGLSGKISADFP